ncbi:translation initiation factor IF-3 [Candidatus Poribacteria bacterium]|nr:translation initiation factor IF-3 [Candidatus Poribacteria bacterium]
MVRVNQQIRAREVLVIDEEGNKLGVMSPTQAITHAEEQQLDLVEVSPKANPPVCKIMDYGKYRYEQSKRAKNAKKRQKSVKVKEIRIRPKIAEHDYQFTKRHIEKFIENGAKAKVAVNFWGREITHTDIGREKLQRLASELNEIAEVEQAPKMEGRSMVMILSPK